MYLLIKYICDRCYAIYKEELTIEKWQIIKKIEDKEAVCSICGKVEGKKTLQVLSPKYSEKKTNNK